MCYGYRVYNSWYEAGLQVFDIDRDTGRLTFVASFDTYPEPVAEEFNGNWGVYPLLGEDKVLLSDITTGLSVVRVRDAR